MTPREAMELWAAECDAVMEQAPASELRGRPYDPLVTATEIERGLETLSALRKANAGRRPEN